MSVNLVCGATEENWTHLGRHTTQQSIANSEILPHHIGLDICVCIIYRTHNFE